MTAGLYYQFVYRALNVQGTSADSAVVTFPIDDAPGQPVSACLLVSSTKTSITISWEKAADTQTPAGTATGHYLYMDDGSQGDFSLVFSGAGYPDQVEHTVDGALVETGLPYRFYTVSENYVGLSTSTSAIAEFRACQAPSGLAAPTRVSTTDSSVELAWTAPEDDGGCTLTGYALLAGDEDAATAQGVSYAEVHSSAVGGDPTIGTFTVTELPPSASAGSNLRFKLMAFNEGGFSVTSTQSLRVVLASVPDQPTAPAARDSALTSPTMLRVTYSAPASVGGSPITNYEVQMDDGIGGGFHTVAGGAGSVYLRTYFTAYGGGACSYSEACELELVSYGLDGQQYSRTVTSISLTKGLTYMVRYRAANSIGWSDWSPVSHVQAANAPEAPEAPTVYATDGSSITLQINPTFEHNGSPVLSYALYMDSGSLGSQAFTLVPGYDGSAETYVVTTGVEGVVSGEKYRFVTTATNVHGESARSPEVRPAVGALPATPSQLTRSLTLSTRTQLTIEWAIEPDTEIPITGYALEWDQAEGEGVFYEIWNGRGRPEVQTYTIAVATGQKYSFRHRSFNANGESAFSPVLETFACVAPVAPGAPTWITSTTSSVSLSWVGSADDGGCPITEYRLFRDAGDGSGDASIEVHAAELAGNSAAVGQVVTELDPTDLGAAFVFQVWVVNDYTNHEISEPVKSGASSPILYAGVPGTPASAPARGASSGSLAIHVDISAIADTNGATLSSYHIAIDDGAAGAFVELQGESLDTLALSGSLATGVVQGRYYRVKYRGRNQIGFGPFSETAYILAADLPDQVEVSGTDAALSASIVGTGLAISWALPQNGGAEITEGQIKIRTSDGATLTEETTHCSLAEDSAEFDGRTCTIPLAALRTGEVTTNAYELAQGDPIVLVIRFKNEVGWSPDSAEYAPAGLLMEAVPHVPTLAPYRIDSGT